jgi:hypothetical protein
MIKYIIDTYLNVNNCILIISIFILLKLYKYVTSFQYYLNNLEHQTQSKYIFMIDLNEEEEEEEKVNLNKKNKSNKKNINNMSNIIDRNNYKQFLNLINEAYILKQKVKIILETEGGNVSSSDIISKTILNYPYTVEVFIASCAFSAGTFIALSCDVIYMNKFSIVSCIDPQLEVTQDITSYSSRTLFNVLKTKKANLELNLSDNFLASVSEARVYHENNLENIDFICKKKKISKRNINIIKDKLCSGNYPHTKPFNSDDLINMGFKIETNNLENYIEVYERFCLLE